MEQRLLNWWEREKMLTPKDKELIEKAKRSGYWEINEDLAETEAGREELHEIKMRDFYREEFMAGLL